MKNIASKLVKVMESCRFVKKQGTNDYHHYKYATASDVMETVNMALVQQTVAVFTKPELIEFQEVVNAKGNVEKLATVRTLVTLVDAESGESIEFVGLGSGQDIGDKSIMKAQTASLKYAYMMTLSIATGDDPEADGTVDERMQNSLEPKGKKVESMISCADCGTVITATMERISLNRYHRPLCLGCQSKEKSKQARSA